MQRPRVHSSLSHACLLHARSRSLSQPETLGELVVYLTELPSASDSEARRYKYPFVASEVLSCDVTSLRDAIFAQPSLLTRLLSLLQLPAPH